MRSMSYDILRNGFNYTFVKARMFTHAPTHKSFLYPGSSPDPTVIVILSLAYSQLSGRPPEILNSVLELLLIHCPCACSSSRLDSSSSKQVQHLHSECRHHPASVDVEAFTSFAPKTKHSQILVKTMKLQHSRDPTVVEPPTRQHGLPACFVNPSIPQSPHPYFSILRSPCGSSHSLRLRWWFSRFDKLTRRPTFC